jgi:isoleucyl-tRNA synthetase
MSYTPLFCPSQASASAVIQAPTNALRIIPALHVTADSGTGLVHCAPAHGAEDYNAFRALGLFSSSSPSPEQNMICHVDGAGEFTAEIADVVGTEAGNKLIGKEVLKEGGKAVVELLKEMGGDVLFGVEKIKHRYPYDWKTDKPVIVT